VQDETLIIAAVVAAALLLMLLLRPRRQPPLTIGRAVARPRPVLPVRKSSLIQHIDDAFEELEIKPVRQPSINGAFDTSDSPLEVIDELTMPMSVPAAAFAAEPTLTVVEDDDGWSPVDELAAFLARDGQGPRDHRAPTVLGWIPASRRAERARTPN
jgi:hypothetical protein